MHIRIFQFNMGDIKKYVKLYTMMLTMVSFVACTQKEGEEEIKPWVLKEEVILPAIENEYKTSAGTKGGSGTYYEIEEGILSGYGSNNCGQLGMGTMDDTGIRFEVPIKIAENVIHVDTSGEFTIYLNDKNELYGMGNNTS